MRAPFKVMRWQALAVLSIARSAYRAFVMAHAAFCAYVHGLLLSRSRLTAWQALHCIGLFLHAIGLDHAARLRCRSQSPTV